ncbi:hypothetical protein AM1_E0003 (plasmid) [Acaryochloris marina MBIC11017]|uniref:Uncharacterized protein n=1 Tax=Acaryochloris marina (strain MBIC 11017) TaxID=329726 RepID=A8ZP37_ACAM1|nr:hypothetical protein AM1_E0003 [Acaryochloris marina MBIC11017]
MIRALKNVKLNFSNKTPSADLKNYSAPAVAKYICMLPQLVS